jgi:predicted NBD/HSP70 family sugar kinase
MKKNVSTPQDSRRYNRAEILRKIYFSGPISRLEISRQIGVSPATVTHIVTGLLNHQVLIETGLIHAGSGRPSAQLSINPDYRMIIGVEAGETFIRAEIFDFQFHLLSQVESALSVNQNTPEDILPAIVRTIEELVAQTGVDRKKIIGAGIGFPGSVDPLNGIAVYTPNWGWNDIHVASILQGHLNIPISLENGANTMAIAEMSFGAGRDADHIAVLLIGTGVGSGIITNRALYRGCSNNAGEIGHTSLNLDGPLCHCGSHGCLEAYIGAYGILQRYLNVVPQPVPPFSGDQPADVQTILDRADRGEAAAVQIVDETLRYAGAGIANLINLFNPRKVLIGGWLGQIYFDRYLPAIRESIDRYALKQSLESTRLELCQCGPEAVAKGAAALVLEHFFNGDLE